MTIRTRLFGLFLILVVVPFTFYTVIVVSQVTVQMESQGFHSADQVLAQAASFVESKADLVKRALDLMSLNPVVRVAAVTDPQVYNKDPGLWIRDATDVKTVVDSVGQNNPDVRTFVFYTEGGLGAAVAGQESSQFLSLKDHGDQAWYRALLPDENRAQWFPPGGGFSHGEPSDVHALRRVPDDLSLWKTAGWIRADVKVRGFEEILDKAEFSPSSPAFLADAQGNLVALSQRAKALGAEALGPLRASSGAGWVRTASQEGVVYRVNRTLIESTGWSLVVAIPEQDIGAFGDRTRSLLVLVLAGMLALLIPISLWAASGATYRLSLLLAGVRRIRDGSLDVSLPEAGQDEIGELTRSFNGMVARIRDLVDEQYRMGLEVKNLELQALQAQINPHFLYNTLDLISGLALRNGQGPIVETVSALSKFYRLSLSGGAEIIPLRKEVDHAEAYVRIQNLRFEAAIHWAVDVPEALGEVPVLKMILQPLVENAILHGILEKPEGQGNIIVRASADGGFLVLEVVDDGVGMSEAVLHGLLAREPVASRTDHGYGVFNIDRRLRLRYGESSGLRYSSVPGQGTRVVLRLPLPASR